MKRVSFLLFLTLLCRLAGAATYYVSTSDGNDANSVTQAKVRTTPWKTASKVNALMAAGTIVNGDVVLFKAGDTFFDTLLLSKGVTIDSFGTGARPIVTGFYTVTAWTNVGGNIYESEALPAPATVSMVAINGKPYAMGRYPNADAANGGYLNYEAHGTLYLRDVTGKPSTVDNATWAGASVVARLNRFIIDHSTITAISGDTIKYATSLVSTPTDGYGYFLENDINALDQLGEWYYNPSTKKLDVYFPNGPTGFTVQVAVKNNLCEPRINNTTIRNINFTGANKYCLYNNFGGVSNLTVDNCRFTYAGSSCLALAGRSGLVIANCWMQYGHNLGIGLTAHVDRPKVLNNTVRDIGNFPGMYTLDANIALRYGNGICAIAQSFETPAYYGGLFRDNTVQNIGYMGIFTAGDSTVIVHNYVDTVCTVMDDGGGIYHGNYEAFGNKYERIDSNIVLHALGIYYGTGSNTLKLGEGIYLDDNSINAIVTRNTSAYNGNSGLYIHNGRKHTIRFNVLFGNGRQFALQDDHVGAFAIDTVVFAQNQLFSTIRGADLIYLAKETDVTTSFSHFFSKLDSNNYCSPFKRKGSAVEDSVIHTNWFSHSQVLYYNLGSWKAFCNTLPESTGYDSHTAVTPASVTDANSIIFKYTIGYPINIRTCYDLLKLDGTHLISGEGIGTYGSMIYLRQ